MQTIDRDQMDFRYLLPRVSALSRSNLYSIESSFADRLLFRRDVFVFYYQELRKFFSAFNKARTCRFGTMGADPF